MITDQARNRLHVEHPAETLKRIREWEIVAAQKRADRIRKQLSDDQSDIDVAFEADGLTFARKNKGWEP